MLLGGKKQKEYYKLTTESEIKEYESNEVGMNGIKARIRSICFRSNER